MPSTMASILATSSVGASLGSLIAAWLLLRFSQEGEYEAVQDKKTTTRKHLVSSSVSPSSSTAGLTRSGSRKMRRRAAMAAAAAAEAAAAPPPAAAAAEAAAESTVSSTHQKSLPSANLPSTLDDGTAETLPAENLPSILDADGTAETLPAEEPSRDVICADALEWLSKPGAVPVGAVVLTGIPDACEVRNFAPTHDAWERWFLRAVVSVLVALPPHGVVIFVQTDDRDAIRGQISKFALVMRAAAEHAQSVKLLWHRVVHFGTVDEGCHGCVKFSHLICFRKNAPLEGDGALGKPADASNVGGNLEPVAGLPDVLWRGIKPRGLNAARSFGAHMTRIILQWTVRQLGVHTVVDPFCGAGTVLAVANVLGLHAVGVDISSKRTKQAQTMDGEALLAFESEMVTAACAQGSTPGNSAAQGVKFSGRSHRQVLSRLRHDRRLHRGS
jgi:hypothetical protein